MEICREVDSLIEARRTYNLYDVNFLPTILTTKDENGAITSCY